MARPLRSTVVTRFMATRGSPPPLGVSVLSASRDIRLRLFPWHHRAGSQVPHQSQDQSHASSTPDITWTVTRSPPCSSRKKCRSPVLMSSVCISRPQPEVHIRSSLWTPHDIIASRLFRNVHHLCHWAEAAYGCSKPAPESRLRRIYLHLWYSMARSKRSALFLTQDILHFLARVLVIETARSC